MEQSNNLPSRLQEETDENFAAFCHYAEMGGTRSVSRCAEEMNIPVGTMMRWSKKHEWHERVLDLQRQANDAATETLKERMFESVEKMRDFKNTILEELKTKFHTAQYCDDCGGHKLSVGEMINILNVVKTELGEPTNITRATVVDPANDPFSIVLSKLFPVAPDANANAAS